MNLNNWKNPRIEIKYKQQQKAEIIFKYLYRIPISQADVDIFKDKVDTYYI